MLTAFASSHRGAVGFARYHDNGEDTIAEQHLIGEILPSLKIGNLPMLEIYLSTSKKQPHPYVTIRTLIIHTIVLGASFWVVCSWVRPHYSLTIVSR